MKQSHRANELKLTSPDEIDAELLGWLKDAYALGYYTGSI
jgi:hypothetical protein